MLEQNEVQQKIKQEIWSILDASLKSHIQERFPEQYLKYMIRLNQVLKMDSDIVQNDSTSAAESGPERIWVILGSSQISEPSLVQKIHLLHKSLQIFVHVLH